jgi:hypothetical protein
MYSGSGGEWRLATRKKKRGSPAEAKQSPSCKCKTVFRQAVQTGISKPTKKSLQGGINRHFLSLDPGC